MKDESCVFTMYGTFFDVLEVYKSLLACIGAFLLGRALTKARDMRLSQCHKLVVILVDLF